LGISTVTIEKKRLFPDNAISKISFGFVNSKNAFCERSVSSLENINLNITSMC